MVPNIPRRYSINIMSHPIWRPFQLVTKLKPIFIQETAAEEARPRRGFAKSAFWASSASGGTGTIP